MAYQINWEPAHNDLHALEADVRSRIINKIGSIIEHPFRFVERLEGFSLYKLRIGDYRAILDIKHNAQEITVILIGHRSKVYKTLNRK